MRYRPTTRQVLVFLAVARHLKLVRAAEELNMSQPAVTSQLNELERNLGLTLFHRTKREVTITGEGRDLLPLMERIADALDGIVEASADFGAARRGRVRMAVLPSVAASLLPDALRSFHEMHPGIEVRISDVVAEDILALVKEGSVDFGIGLRLRADHAITEAPLLSDELQVFAPQGHPLAQGSAPTLADCAHHPQVVTTPGSSVRLLLERALTGVGAEITIAMEVSYMSTALAAVRAGLGVAILPSSARDAGNAEGLVRRRIGPDGLPREICLLSRRGQAPSTAAEMLIEHLRESFGVSVV